MEAAVVERGFECWRDKNTHRRDRRISVRERYDGTVLVLLASNALGAALIDGALR